MTLLAAPAPAQQPPDRPRAAALLRHPSLLGLLASGGTLLLVILLALLVSGTDTRSSVSDGTTVQVGAMAWLALHGTGVVAGDTSLDVLPLLAVLLPVGAALATLRRALADAAVGGRSVSASVAQWWLGYVVGLVAGVVLTLGGAAHPIWWRLALACVVVPGLAAGGALAGGPHGTVDAVPLLARLPLTVRRAWPPAVWGVGALLALGALAVVVLVVLRRDTVLAVHQALDPQGVGSAILWSLQVAALPNLAIWAVSFAVGTGFELVDGAWVTWSGIEGGLLPLIPVFGAVPQTGAFPWFCALLALIPVAVGTQIGRRAVHRLPRLSAMRAKAATAVTAALFSALLLGLLALFGGSNLGTYRLSGIGAPVHWLVPALALELVAGALVAVLWDGWRLRR
ncbi:MAG: hypothetical protein KBB39_01410 [Phycicoccus sp.]|nr:hypothetical protein [Phycicoccus sp.]